MTAIIPNQKQGLGRNQRALLELLDEGPLFKREIASWLHHGVAGWNGYQRPKDDDFSRASRLADSLVKRGLAEWRPYGEGRYRRLHGVPWRRNDDHQADS